MIGGLNFNIIVADGNQVSDGVAIQCLLGLQEGADLPLLIVLGVELLKFGPRTDNRNVTLDFLVNTGEEASRTHLDPALCRISNDECHLRS